MKDTELKKYYKKIRRTLLCPAKEKTKFISDFKNSVDDYLSSHPDASLEEVQTRFGTPRSIAETFAADLSAQTLRKYRRLRLIKIVIFSVLSAIAAFIIGLSIYILATNDPGFSYEVTVEDNGIVEVLEE